MMHADDDPSPLADDRRAGREARRPRLGRRRPAHPARAPDRLPRPDLGACRRAARSRRPTASGRSTFVVTVTATRLIRRAARTPGAASPTTRSGLRSTSPSPAIRRSSRVAIRRARPRSYSAKRARTGRSHGCGPTSRSCSPTTTRFRRPTTSRSARHARKRRNEWSSADEAFDTYSSKPPLNAMTPESLRAYVEYGLRDRGDGVLELKCRPEVESRGLRDGTGERRVGRAAEGAAAGPGGLR